MDIRGLPAADDRHVRPEVPSVGALAPADAAEIARIHCAALPDGFLARLGPEVLRRIYVGVLVAPGTVGLAVRQDGRIAAFLVATADTHALFRHLLRHQTLSLAVPLLAAVCRRPRLAGEILQTLRYPATLREKQWPPSAAAELMALAVRAECRSGGCARALVDALNGTFQHMGVGAYTVGVYSSNGPANAAYRRLGFEPWHRFEMLGAPWTRYGLRLGPAFGVPDGGPGATGAGPGVSAS
jgi:ribosomal protein S18 acetylase RimI-like enzyme